MTQIRLFLLTLIIISVSSVYSEEHSLEDFDLSIKKAVDELSLSKFESAASILTHLFAVYEKELESSVPLSFKKTKDSGHRHLQD